MNNTGKYRRLVAGSFLALLTCLKPLDAAELVMFESPACEWCEVWDEEVGVIYAKTDEARIVPLRRMDIDDPRNGALASIRPVMYTPTFVMMDGGKEVGRILGYPGESHFWGLLGELISRIKAPVGSCLTTKTASAVTTKGTSC